MKSPMTEENPVIYFRDEAQKYALAAVGTDMSQARLMELFNNAMVEAFELALTRAAEQTTNFRVKRAILDLR